MIFYLPEKHKEWQGAANAPDHGHWKVYFYKIIELNVLYFTECKMFKYKNLPSFIPLPESETNIVSNQTSLEILSRKYFYINDTYLLKS